MKKKVLQCVRIFEDGEEVVCEQRDYYKTEEELNEVYEKIAKDNNKEYYWRIKEIEYADHSKSYFDLKKEFGGEFSTAISKAKAKISEEIMKAYKQKKLTKIEEEQLIDLYIEDGPGFEEGWYNVQYLYNKYADYNPNELWCDYAKRKGYEHR